MIGVIAKPGQPGLVEEFFELFKTPWELYCPGRVYDVVLTTVDEGAEVNARLLLVYGPATKDMDARIGVVAEARQRGALVNDRETELPIYGELLTFTAGSGHVCVAAGGAAAGIRAASANGVVIRLGYDLFEEVKLLLSAGQPPEYAHLPALDIHIRMLREWILEAGISLLEIPPAPAGHSFVVCLTHDIDFVGIRNHCLDHSMWGFVFRATIGGLRKFRRGRLSLSRLLQGWRAVASLPFVYAGWARDFWEPFEWYLKVEKGLSPTYFLIPFKRRAGERVQGRNASRRAAAYGAADLRDQVKSLQSQGCEVGVHGIDAWHDAVKGRAEKTEVTAVAGECSGIRMHWLLRDQNTPAVLERAGYSYDSTCGYNETVGFRAGTGQVFRPLGARTLLELPMHIQDGALFYAQRLDLTEPEAEKRCQGLIDHARKSGGVLTLLWHDRSHGPERFWGDFYAGLVQTLRALDGWFATAGQAAGWFRQRRGVRFEAIEAEGRAHIRLCYDGEEIQPPLRIRIYRSSLASDADKAAAELIDISWNGKPMDEVECQITPLCSLS